MSQPAQDTILFVFDFDSTTVAETADVWVMEWVPRLRDLFRLEWEHADCWHTFARRIPELLYEKGYTESDLRERLAGMSFLGGMGNVFKKIGEHSSTELVVASDANVAYISCFLESKGLLQAVDHIHSNPAEFDDKGKLIISPYHKHSCERCKEAPNMCKGKIMREILKEKSYNKVVYVGDGGNDICPTFRTVQQRSCCGP